MYLERKGESENLLRLPKILTFILATTVKSTYPLVTISRTQFRFDAKGKWFVSGKDGPELDISQDGGDGGARAAQWAG